jgi:2-polyprenyl-6-methoxyphenol hydroxylase-like FAD-dependent oxidoreductase
VTRIAVIGAGTAGAAAATLLARAGHEVSVFERVPDPKPIGAGIVLQPTGLAVLEHLGLRERVVERGARLAALRCLTRGGRAIVNLAYENVAEAFFGLGTHRGLLFEALMDAMVRESVTLRCGVAITAIAHERDLPVLVGEDGERHGPWDLVVVADGARSKLRESLARTKRDVAYPWGALWFVAEDREGAFDRELHQVVDGTRKFLGLLPSGKGPSTSSDAQKVSLFWSVRCDAVDDVRRRGLAAFRDEVLRYEPRAEPVLDQIDDVDQLLVAQYRDVVLDRFHHGRLVCIGDAAHSMSPQLGQGANLALVDALVLASCVAGDPDVPRALAEYSARRQRHLAFYQRMTRWLTPFFQSDARWLTPLRDVGMALACRIPPIRNRMIRTMCGIERGFLRRSIDLSDLADSR